jgi:hypothetical protein
MSGVFSVPCSILKVTGHDLYGAEITGCKKREFCAVLELSRSAVFSTVRVDSSATRGAANESRAVAKLLLSSRTSAEIGDLIVVHSYRLKVASKSPQFSASGKLNHYMIECDID